MGRFSPAADAVIADLYIDGDLIDDIVKRLWVDFHIKATSRQVMERCRWLRNKGVIDAPPRDSKFSKRALPGEARARDPAPPAMRKPDWAAVDQAFRFAGRPEHCAEAARAQTTGRVTARPTVEALGMGATSLHGI